MRTVAHEDLMTANTGTFHDFAQVSPILVAPPESTVPRDRPTWQWRPAKGREHI